MSKCPSIHIHTGQQCIREVGHDGFCYGKMTRCKSLGTINRVHWRSKDGKFKSHHWYETHYVSANRCPPPAAR